MAEFPEAFKIRPKLYFILLKCFYSLFWAEDNEDGTPNGIRQKLRLFEPDGMTDESGNLTEATAVKAIVRVRIPLVHESEEESGEEEGSVKDEESKKESKTKQGKQDKLKPEQSKQEDSLMEVLQQQQGLT